MFIIMLSIAGVSAGWFKDLFQFGEDREDLEGELPASYTSSVTIANSAPTIVSWTEPDSDTVTAGIQAYIPTCNNNPSATLVEENPGANRIGVKVTISDPNGCEDVRADGVVTMYFYKGTVNRPGGGTPAPVTCTAPPTCTGNNVEFTCPGVSMNYYDVTGTDWIIRVSATDGTSPATNNNKISDGTANFRYLQYATIPCIHLEDSDDPTFPTDTIAWAGVTPGQTNLESSPYMKVFNDGNVAVTSLLPYSSTGSYLKVSGSSLIGIANPTQNIPVGSFSVDESTAGSLPCDASPLQTLTSTLAYIIPAASGAASLSIDTDTPPRVERPLYFCLETVPTGLPADSYESTSWAIEICTTGC